MTTKDPDNVTFKLIHELEIELSKPQTRSNPQRLSALLHDEFKEIGASGRTYKKADVLRESPSNNNLYQLSDFSFKTLSSDCILIEYQSISNGVTALRSSIWIKENNKWQILHHHGTVV